MASAELLTWIEMHKFVLLASFAIVASVNVAHARQHQQRFMSTYPAHHTRLVAKYLAAQVFVALATNLKT
jgi:hypothetical protein